LADCARVGHVFSKALDANEDLVDLSDLIRSYQTCRMPPFDKIDASKHARHRPWNRNFTEEQWQLCVQQRSSSCRNELIVVD